MYGSTTTWLPGHWHSSCLLTASATLVPLTTTSAAPPHPARPRPLPPAAPAFPEGPSTTSRCCCRRSCLPRRCRSWRRCCCCSGPSILAVVTLAAPPSVARAAMASTCVLCDGCAATATRAWPAKSLPGCGKRAAACERAGPPSKMAPDSVQKPCKASGAASREKSQQCGVKCSIEQ